MVQTFAPVSLTWPDGSHIDFTREGDVVTMISVLKSQSVKSPILLPPEFAPTHNQGFTVYHGTSLANGFFAVVVYGVIDVPEAGMPQAQVSWQTTQPGPWTTDTARYIGQPMASGTAGGQLLVSTDAEQAVIDELSPVWPISTSIPEPKPDLFFRVVRVGGDTGDLVRDTPVLTLEAFALRETAAASALAEAVARLELAARQGHIGNEVAYSLSIASLSQNYPLPSVPSHKRYMTTIAPALRRRITTL